jgi:HD-GYP domain-containing protein (c-di-GMP phosphodiesterase class II)
MIKEPHINLDALVIALSKAMDLVSPSVAHHQIKVAYLAFNIASELGWSGEKQRELILAGALHDCGALSLKDRLKALRFEIDSPYRHAEFGYRLLKNFKPFSPIALLIRYHHTPWQQGKGAHFNGEAVPLGSHILHLADRVEVLIDRKREILSQVKVVCKKIQQRSGDMFHPELIEAFLSLASKEFFWLDITQAVNYSLVDKMNLASLEVGLDGLFGIARLFSQMVDFRSRFTVTHSSGVAAVAEKLSHLAGFSERHCRMMKIAGYFHDLGKLAIPSEILEKKGKLTEEEYSVVKSHPYYTHSILETFPNLEMINSWASLHHERMDGKGYPFRLKGEDLLLGSRIMAVADIFAALTENRPYRKGLTGRGALKILQQMVRDSALDGQIVSDLKVHYKEAETLRRAAQKEELEEYQQFYQQQN